MSDVLDVVDEYRDRFLRKPLFWHHVWGIVSYPVKILRFYLGMRAINRMFGRQQVLALRPIEKLSPESSRLILDVERETRIDVPERVQ